MNTLEAEVQTVEGRYLFCAEQFARLTEVGVFDKSDRVELLDGEIIVMAPIGKKHEWVVSRLSKLFHQRFGDKCYVQTQNPFQLGPFSVPQPDLQICHASATDYWPERPSPQDICVLVEVSDSSLQYDRGRKLDAYAQAGIIEYWIVNLQDETVDVFREPQDGTFTQALVFRRGAQVNCMAFPEVVFTVDELFPPRE